MACPHSGSIEKSTIARGGISRKKKAGKFRVMLPMGLPAAPSPGSVMLGQGVSVAKEEWLLLGVVLLVVPRAILALHDRRARRRMDVAIASRSCPSCGSLFGLDAARRRGLVMVMRGSDLISVRCPNCKSVAWLSREEANTPQSASDGSNAYQGPHA